MGKVTGRRAGILLALSSLPGAQGHADPRGPSGLPDERHGPPPAGVLGKPACDFVDFLAEAGQSLWQILPIGPVGAALSPYQSRSAFAGNPGFIDWGDVQSSPGRYAAKGAAYMRFLKENAAWIDDYALFEAVRGSQQGRPLSQWPDWLRNPSAKTLSGLRDRYGQETASVRHEQFCFFLQWQGLKRYANLKGVGIIGDLPIYVYEDSAEFWLRRRAFDAGKDGRPRASAGVPPDGFSEGGQIWNNPVYDWERGRKEAFAFWRERLAQAARLYDGVRIDHFRAFADFYAIPLETQGALSPSVSSASGEWRPGPGKAFTDMLRKEFPGFFIIAEDLGELSETAARLVEESGFPGMKVMQFAFSGDPANPYLPHNIPENAVAFTGTHDNNTLLGWTRGAPRPERRFAMRYLGLSSQEGLAEALLAQTLACRADTAIIPLQDWLGLGAEARMNKPGTKGGRNWKWQYPKDALTRRLAARIRLATKGLYGR